MVVLGVQAGHIGEAGAARLLIGLADLAVDLLQRLDAVGGEAGGEDGPIEMFGGHAVGDGNRIGGADGGKPAGITKSAPSGDRPGATSSSEPGAAPPAGGADPSKG